MESGTLVCYADDTLVLAGGEDWKEVKAVANVAVACVVRAIGALGLRVAAKKTEAVFFHDGSAGPPPETQITVDGVDIKVGAQIKYLGLHIDERWKFEEHFARLAPRLDKAGNALSRLMPRLGPGRAAWEDETSLRQCYNVHGIVRCPRVGRDPPEE
ncbi:PREDICTED: uncharacterized protein LOC105570741 [Vollenhovia emeryi]|uniref:uncharacterized protein LOC105570741 n=1 Tax=Vollenhovia emeryi TaxID=411798 RepID=UPI0005F3E5DC|nr:PREDICTED: uncharacterized protein LOC105570741 [Vollenhovia emeryi]